MLTDFLTRPCTILTSAPTGTQDRYGNDETESAEAEALCELQQRARREDTAAGPVAVDEWALFLPADAELGVDSRVVVDGVTYEVKGTPWPARNPRTGEVEHIEATVVQTSGAAS